MIGLLGACAIGMFQPLVAFEGLYVGGAVGGALLDGRQPGVGTGVVTTTSPNIYTSEHNTHYFDEKFLGELYAGIGYRRRTLYLGLEAFGKYSKHHVSHDLKNDNIFPIEAASEGIFHHNSVTLGPWHYGADFRPGILLTPQTMLYGRIGVVGTRFSFNTRIKNSLVIPGNSFEIPVSESAHKHGHFLRVGLGMEQFLGTHLAFRWDYVFTNYRSLATEGSNRGTLGPSTLTVRDSNQHHLKTHELKLALSYYFSAYPEYYFQKYRCLQRPNFCGTYLGVGLGGGFENSGHKVDVVNISPGPESVEIGIHPYVFNKQLNEKAIRTVMYGGYNLQFDFPMLSLVTGIELFAQYFPYVNKSTDRKLFINGFNAPLFSANTTLKSNLKVQPWQYGVQLRPGILLTPSTLLFGTVGVSVAKLDSRYDALYQNPPAGVSLNLPLSHHATRAVLRLGGGLEYVLYKNWHLRGDYVYTNYRSVDLKGSKSFNFGSPLGTISIISDSTVHIKDHAVTVGIARYF